MFVSVPSGQINNITKSFERILMRTSRLASGNGGTRKVLGAAPRISYTIEKM